MNKFKKEGFYYVPFRLKGRATRRERFYTYGLLFAFGRLNQHTKREGLNFNNNTELGFNASHGSELLRNGVVGLHHSITPGLVL